MRYFDFHAHILFKQIFDENPNLDSRISATDVGGIPRLCTDLPRIIQSQIHQSQLAEHGDEVIVGAVLYGLESYLADEVIPLRTLLKSGSQHKLSRMLLDDVVSNRSKSFTDFTLARTLDNYINAAASFNLLNSASFDAPLPKNKVNVFFVIEGCHSLVDTHNKFLPPDEFFPVQEILDNLDILLQKASVLSINPTHLQQSNLCNHAFGMQLAKIERFVPTGNGMKDDGRTVIQGIFDRNICVDVKHMSFKSRRDLMNEIDNGDFQNIQPLVCTHAGFTGIPFSDWAGYIHLKKQAAGGIYLEIAKSMQTRNEPQNPGAPSFNATTINLFDEEIAWIVDNGGMIGVSLDRRILGYIDKFDENPTGRQPDSELIVDKEYFSKEEWASLGINERQLRTKIEEGDCVTVTTLEENTDASISARNEFFLDHILLHLKHYFQACVNAGIPVATAQKHITIGSDFDGLINPFLNLTTVEDMSDLKTYITANFGIYLRGLLDSRVWMHELNIVEFVDDLFYNNGFNFVKSRF